MSSLFQNEKKINLKLDLHMCGGQKKADLPLKMQVAKVVKMRREKQKIVPRCPFEKHEFD
ncbi:putative type VI secretion protein [Escherichia coli]|nr:putative type VI secretion protein [Escherichia coli]CTX58497.1 putative type VI secretion protein [Escherichia coli]